MSLSNLFVVIPAFNADRTIARVIADVQAVVNDASIIVVNDGSTDLTREIVSATDSVYHLEETENRGKGYALRKGFAYALRRQASYILTMDADGQHDASDIPNLMKYMTETGAEVVVGSRMTSTEGMPLHRRFSNRITSFLVSKAIGQCVPDSQCGFRLYRKEPLLALSSSCNRFDFETEILLEIGKAGGIVASTPVKLIYHSDGVSSVRLRDVHRFIITMLRGL